MAEETKIELRTIVTDEDGNEFPADLTIDMVELKEKLSILGYTLKKRVTK